MMRATFCVSSCKHNIFPMLYLHTIKQTLQPINFPFWCSVIWKSNIITKNIIQYGIGTYKHQEYEILCSSIKKKENSFSIFIFSIFCYAFSLFQNKLNKNISNINAQKEKSEIWSLKTYFLFLFRFFCYFVLLKISA